jgi:hypothetical protein
LKLNGTHQLLAYADDVNILGRSVHTVKENTEALVVAIAARLKAGRVRVRIPKGIKNVSYTPKYPICSWGPPSLTLMGNGFLS